MIKLNTKKLSTIEAIAFTVILIINHTILDLPKIILLSAGSASIINTIYVSILAVILCLLIVNLFKPFPGKDIIDIAEFLGGKILKVLIGFAFIISFSISLAIVLKYFSDALKVIYFPSTPILLIMLFFLLPCILSNKIGLKAISRANLILLPIIIISIIIIILSISHLFVPERALPILGNGFKSTFLVGASNIFAFSGLRLYFPFNAITSRLQRF